MDACLFAMTDSPLSIKSSPAAASDVASRNRMSSTLVETVSINYEDFSDSFLTCGTCLCVYDGAERAPKLLACSHTVRDIYNLKLHKYLCITDTNPNPNPNHTTNQHAIVNFQLNIVTCPTYPDNCFCTVCASLDCNYHAAVHTWSVVHCPFLPFTIGLVLIKIINVLNNNLQLTLTNRFEQFCRQPQGHENCGIQLPAFAV